MLNVTLSITNGRILVTSKAGVVKLDTNNKLFHITDELSGNYAISWPPVIKASEAFLRSKSYFIGYCNPTATHVIGMFCPTNDNTIPALWYNANGTHIHRQHWMSSFVTNRDRKGSLRHIIHYTFRVSGGAVYLDEYVYMSAYDNGGLQSSLPYALIAFNIAYKLKVGMFS